MTDFGAIDALLAGARKEVPLPPAEERRRLREELNLSRPQLAQALSVSSSTVAGWETGRDPSGETREKYAYFLEGARTKLAAVAAESHGAEAGGGPEEPGDPAELHDTEELDGTRAVVHDGDDGATLTTPQPCVLCGQPAHHQVAGFPQHLAPADCGTPTPSAPSGHGTPPTPASASARRGVKIVPVGRRLKSADAPDLIGSAVAAALAEHSGDVEAATAALVKRAIPDAMALLDHSRMGGRYELVAHPWLPDVLRKQSSRGADQIWEARPKWTRPELPPGEHEITALDVNGAYLSALKTHLPLGQLEHSTGDHHDRRRAGVHLITPPAWGHDAYLPNRSAAGTNPARCGSPNPPCVSCCGCRARSTGCAPPPQIHESWTSGATEGLLEKFRVTLKDARDRAIADGDEVTLEYVKAMYSKFVSTLGESNYNRELYRTDWMHLIRSQAFANLWWKAHRAYDEGLLVVRAMGTDELHVSGDWRAVFPEGRGVAEVKVKDVYAVGTGPADDDT